MTIQDMHYDFKTKLNKIDSQQYRNLRIPEIDWKLNEAQELFVKLVANPRLKSGLGFETSQRTIDDIRSIVVDNYTRNVDANGVVILPADYWSFISAKTTMTKGVCTGFEASIRIKQHDDEYEKSPFDSSSFEWREVNGVFINEGLKLFTDGTFVNNVATISYIKKLEYINYSEGFGSGSYNLPNGDVLAGNVNCTLPIHTHREIVDIAVLIATADLQLPDWEQKQAKVNLNQRT